MAFFVKLTFESIAISISIFACIWLSKLSKLHTVKTLLCQQFHFDLTVDEAEEAKKEERLTGGSSGKSWLDSDRDYTYDEVCF